MDNIEEHTKKFYLDRRVSVTEPNYYDRIAQYVGWTSQHNQYLGFEVATNFPNIDWQNITSILDVGCGYGNLVEYLRENKNFTGIYVGIDLVSEFIINAQSLYGLDSRNKFIHANFLTQDWHQQKYDIVISLGVLSVNFDQPHQYGEKSKYYANESIALMVKLAKVAVSIYFLNEVNALDKQKQVNFDVAFYQPSDIQQMIENATVSKYESLTIASYPDVNNVKTMAKVCFV